MFFLDKAHFHHDGYVSKQNGRLGPENLQQLHEKPLHHVKTHCLWRLWDGGEIKPSLFLNMRSKMPLP